MKTKVNKNDFLEMVAKKNNMQPAEVRAIYDSMIEVARSILCKRQDLSLTGFGTFSLQTHKGHPVQFRKNSKNTVDDYVVLKFAVSDVLMSKIRDSL